MNTDKIKAAVKVECDRQQVGEDRRQRLEAAYLYLRNTHEYATLTDQMLTRMAVEIEPDNKGQYRHLPVTFNGIVGGVDPSQIWWVMLGWIRNFNLELFLPNNEEFVEVTIKEFLDIHPFSDGNGRLAWLLRVWMLDQWDDPQPLPNYYG